MPNHAFSYYIIASEMDKHTHIYTYRCQHKNYFKKLDMHQAKASAHLVK